MGGPRVTIATSERLVERVRDAARGLAVDIAVLDELTIETIATLRNTSPVTVAVVGGKDAAVAAYAAGCDDVLEDWLLSPDLLDLAVRIATERAAARYAREEADHARAEDERVPGHRERLAALGAVAAGVAHEISSPVSAVAVNLEMLRAELNKPVVTMQPAELRQVLDDTLASMRVIGDLVRDLRSLGRTEGDAPPEVVDVGALVRQVVRLAAPRTLPIEIDDPDVVPHLWLPRTRLMQVLTNLVTNAVHAMSEFPRPLHRLKVSIRLDESSLMVAIADTGGGIPEGDLRRVFDPFYTTKSAQTGTGLGLPLSRRFVRELGGDLTLDSIVGEGTIAMVFLPLALRTLAATGSTTAPRRPRLLIVEPDPAALLALEQLLRPHFELLSARSGAEALDILSSGARVQRMVYDHTIMAGASPLHAVIAEHAPALLQRTVFLRSGRKVPRGAAATVRRSAIETELVDALERISVDDGDDVGSFADRPLIP